MADGTLIWITGELGSEDLCLDAVERLRWPEGVRCLDCESLRVFKFLTAQGTKRVKRTDGRSGTTVAPARRVYECVDCGRQFTATSGTVFHDTHLPLTKWFLAVALMINADGNVTAGSIQRHLRVSYKTAWHLRHRIRMALGEPANKGLA